MHEFLLAKQTVSRTKAEEVLIENNNPMLVYVCVYYVLIVEYHSEYLADSTLTEIIG